MATVHGIAVTKDSAIKLPVSAYFLPKGEGLLRMQGAFTSEVRNVLLACIEAVRAIEPYFDEVDSSKFATCNLNIVMETDVPVAGESYGLPLAMAIVSAMLHKSIDTKTCFTGVIEPGGAILNVEDIDRKRKHAARLGFKKLVLPSPQLDVFNTSIDQVPVDTLTAAITGHFWE